MYKKNINTILFCLSKLPSNLYTFMHTWMFLQMKAYLMMHAEIECIYVTF